MCGYVGIYYKDNYNEEKINISDLSDRIVHRGPDDVGIYSNEKVDLAFRRLSIIDVDNGHQPFQKQDYTIVFNGEIYNYRELKEELINKGYEFKTESDTEVLLTSYIDMGEQCVDKLRGMFSFIIWDINGNKIFGARDPFGIKPLYYVEDDNLIAFSSEYKTLVDIKDKEVDLEELQVYLSFQYTLFNRTMMKNIKKIPEGHCFTIENDELEIRRYYHTEFNESDVSVNDIVSAIEDSVKHHMISDVPLGTFLSGGIDSTIVATLASKINPNIKSFSVGFDIEGYNEIDIAKRTAECLGIENISVYVTQDDYIKALPQVIKALDDPLADPSALGLYFLSKEARKHVTVCLSGEGSDEFFGGYNIYGEYNYTKYFEKLPKNVNAVLRTISEKMPEMKGKAFLYRGATDLSDRYIGNAKLFDNNEVEAVVRNYNGDFVYQNVLKDLYKKAEDSNYDHVTTMQYIDSNTWLPGDILLKGDKMSMANSLEVRVPFLDKKVFEVASKLKIDDKVNKKTTKVLLREAFKDIIPSHIVNQPKLGFPTPIRVWLKDKLGDVVRETILESNTDNLINKEYAINLLDKHIRGEGDQSRKVWAIYIFCLWHQIFVEGLDINYTV